MSRGKLSSLCEKVSPDVSLSATSCAISYPFICFWSKLQCSFQYLKTKVCDDSIIWRKLTLPYGYVVLLAHLLAIQSLIWGEKWEKVQQDRIYLRRLDIHWGNGIQFHIICLRWVRLPTASGFFLGSHYRSSIYQYWGNKFEDIEIQVIWSKGI